MWNRLKKRAQRGVTLVFAMLALVALTLGAVALIRSVDTSVLALGNLAFKQSGLTSGGRVAQTALNWVRDQLAVNDGASLQADVPASGYYATSLDTLDPTAAAARSANVQALVDWDGNGCLVDGQNVNPPACIQPSAATQVGEDTVRFVITRLCRAAGPVDDNGGCARPPLPDSVEGANKGINNCLEDCLDADLAPATMYRVITRTLGPKGTTTFTETLAHF